MPPSLFAIARGCLDAATPEAKVAATFAAGESFARGECTIPSDATPPEPIQKERLRQNVERERVIAY